MMPQAFPGPLSDSSLAVSRHSPAVREAAGSSQDAALKRGNSCRATDARPPAHSLSHRLCTNLVQRPEALASASACSPRRVEVSDAAAHRGDALRIRTHCAPRFSTRQEARPSVSGKSTGLLLTEFMCRLGHGLLESALDRHHRPSPVALQGLVLIELPVLAGLCPGVIAGAAAASGPCPPVAWFLLLKPS